MKGSETTASETTRWETVVVTPAGRRRYLEKLVVHLEKQRSDFKEWHLWVNTDDADDIQYLNDLEAAHEWIKLVHVDNIDPVKGKHYDASNIHKFFHYTNDENTVYIRLDDDIVWLEDNFVKNLVAFRLENPDYFLVYANIVNNCVIDHIHQKIGALENFKYGHIDYDCLGNAWRKCGPAHEIHTRFIEARKNGTTEIWKFEQWVLEENERVSINAICWLGPSFKGISVGRKEEEWLATDYPKQAGLKNVVFGKALCVHLGFFPQRKKRINGLLLDDRIDEMSE